MQARKHRVVKTYAQQILTACQKWISKLNEEAPWFLRVWQNPPHLSAKWAFIQLTMLERPSTPCAGCFNWEADSLTIICSRCDPFLPPSFLKVKEIWKGDTWETAGCILCSDMSDEGAFDTKTLLLRHHYSLKNQSFWKSETAQVQSLMSW